MSRPALGAVPMVRHVLALLVGAVLALPSVASASEALYGRIGERLALMRDVAAYKWLHDLPVTDSEREARVLDSAAADGLRFQIEPDSTRRLFAVQIEAAKDIQRYWFERWAAGPAPDSAPDLVGELRPHLLQLGEEILALAAEPVTGVSADRFYEIVRTDGLERDRADELLSAVAALERYPSRLAQILDTGVLRVGTTGDYAPFSFSGDDETFTGMDVDLAHDLAVALGVRLELIRTSWPTLIDDLLDGRYDVAMSGVSRTPARARVGYLSVPYFVGGKSAIARCEDKRRFKTLADIDQPDVRIIVNPGGTNEAFVDEHVRQAQKVLHPDNRTIFTALAAGEADVMVTDNIEVLLQTQKNPGLCGTMGRTLTYQEKGYLMPRDADLKNFVDTWLELRLGDGTVNALLEKHLTAR